MSHFISFDLEGPLTPQDNAYELMKLIPSGDRVFEVISRYDDLLTLEGKPDYEPGDTLALIVPFLARFGVTEQDIAASADRATLVPGAQELVNQLKNLGWDVFCISTTYQQYAFQVAARVGILPSHVAATLFPLDEFRSRIRPEDLAQVDEVKETLMKMKPIADDGPIKDALDRFYWDNLASRSLGELMSRVKPVGGRRKMEKLLRFLGEYPTPLSEVVVVGDSITDNHILQTVRDAKGLAIAFNANEYAIPQANVGLASTYLSDLLPILLAWAEGRWEMVEPLVREKEKAGGKGDRDHCHWLIGRKDMEEPLAVHRRIRRLVRAEAGKLG